MSNLDFKELIHIMIEVEDHVKTLKLLIEKDVMHYLSFAQKCLTKENFEEAKREMINNLKKQIDTFKEEKK